VSAQKKDIVFFHTDFSKNFDGTLVVHDWPPQQLKSRKSIKFSTCEALGL
jgi:hypothetical protein